MFNLLYELLGYRDRICNHFSSEQILLLFLKMTVSLLNAITGADNEPLRDSRPLYWQQMKSTVSNSYHRTSAWFWSFPWQEILQFSLLTTLGLSYGVFFLSVFGVIGFPWWAATYLVLWLGFLCVLSFY